MNLVLVGRQTLDELEGLAVTHFSDVVDKGQTALDFSGEVDRIYDEESLGHVFHMVPNKNLKQLRVLWNLPGSNDLWRSKPSSYLSHLLGHEGPGSLLSQLIREGLATSLQSGNSTRLHNLVDQLRIEIGLTEEGERQYLRVLELVYKFVNALRREGVREYVQEECRRMNEIDFDNITKSSALSYANSLCSRLSKVSKEEEIAELLWRPYAKDEFRPEEIKRRIDLLRPERSVVVFVSKGVQQEGLMKEKWYGTQFRKEKLSDDFLANLEKTLPTANEPMGYPPANHLIPTELTEKRQARAPEAPPSYPRKLVSPTPSTVWFKQDDQFAQPLTYAFLKIETGDLLYPLTPVSQAFSFLWKSCLFEHLREESYMASLAGLSYHLDISMDDLTLEVSGYNSKTAAFFKDLLQASQGYTIERRLFEAKKALVIRQYENEAKKEPSARLDSYKY